MICRCGHEESLHHRRKSCTATIDAAGLKFCKCEEFRAKNQIEGEEEMAKEKKVRTKKEKKETTPKLAPFVDSSFKIYLVMGKKEREATVLSSGLIRFKEEEFKSPCAAATAMAKDMDEKWDGPNAWSRLKFNKDGERVSLDTIRGAKSPLAKIEKKPRVKKEKPAAKKPRAPRKRKEAIAVVEKAAAD